MPIWTEQQLEGAIAAKEIGFITLDTSIFGVPAMIVAIQT